MLKQSIMRTGGVLIISDKRIVVYGLDISIDPKKCAWVWLDSKGKVTVGEPGVFSLVSSLKEHIDCRIYFGIEAPMWIPELKDANGKIPNRFEEEINREWYRDSGAGASMKAMVLWKYIKNNLGVSVEKVDIHPFEGFVTGSYKPSKEVYLSIMDTLKEIKKDWVTEDMIDAYIIAHARWSDLIHTEMRVVNYYYEKLVKDRRNLSGRYISLWDGLKKLKYPVIYGYKFQWHLKEIVEGENIVFSGDDLRIYRKATNIEIKISFKKQYNSLKFSISSKDIEKIEDIFLVNDKSEKVEKTQIAHKNVSQNEKSGKEKEFIFVCDQIEQSTLSFVFNEIDSSSFISLKKPYLNKICP